MHKEIRKKGLPALACIMALAVSGCGEDVSDTEVATAKAQQCEKADEIEQKDYMAERFCKTVIEVKAMFGVAPN